MRTQINLKSRKINRSSQTITPICGVMDISTYCEYGGLTCVPDEHLLHIQELAKSCISSTRLLLQNLAPRQNI